MENYLRAIVEQIAKPSLRNATNNTWYEAMDLIEQLIIKTGHIPTQQSWIDNTDKSYKNFTVEIKGKIDKKIILGAHYDTFDTTPRADDNGSAVAVLLGILSLIDPTFIPYYTLEIIFYACEEPPYYGTDQMGSYKAASIVDKDSVEIMICLEMVGFFSDEKNSQDYPFWFLKYFLGSKGNFLLGVSNYKSRKKAKLYLSKLKNYNKSFYKKFIPPFNMSGLDWSDHRNYWLNDIPALMLTDTAMFRNKNYHTEKDLPNTLDYNKMAILVDDLFKLVKEQN